MIVCELLITLGLSFGWCEPPKKTEVFKQNGDDVYRYNLPEPEPVNNDIISFPPVVLEITTPKPPEQKKVAKARRKVKPTIPRPPSWEELAFYASLDLRRNPSQSSSSGFLVANANALSSLPALSTGLRTGLVQSNTSSDHIAATLVDSSGYYQEVSYPTDDEYTSAKARSSLPVRNERILTADRYITGLLETGLNSQIGTDDGGSMIIQTNRDVFSYHGRNILIPKGSRLICSYQPPTDLSRTRLAISCYRILFAGHRAEINELASVGSDQQGRIGIAGNIDRRFFEKYGTALLLTALSATVSGTSNYLRSENQTSNYADGINSAAEETAIQLGSISAQALQQTINLTPVITIAQGTRVVIRPQADWYIQPVEQ